MIGFCNGGGAEHRNVELFQALVGRFGADAKQRLYTDLRAAEHRDAPVSTRRRFPYPEGEPERLSRFPDRRRK